MPKRGRGGETSGRRDDAKRSRTSDDFKPDSPQASTSAGAISSPVSARDYDSDSTSRHSTSSYASSAAAAEDEIGVFGTTRDGHEICLYEKSPCEGFTPCPPKSVEKAKECIRSIAQDAVGKETQNTWKLCAKAIRLDYQHWYQVKNENSSFFGKLFAILHVQQKSETYAATHVELDHEFGHEIIQGALRESLEKTKENGGKGCRTRLVAREKGVGLSTIDEEGSGRGKEQGAAAKRRKSGGGKAEKKYAKRK